MSTTQIHGTEAAEMPGAATIDMNLEVVVIPVSDVDRAVDFYRRLGWRFDGDFRSGDHFRGIQFTPKGSGCSIQFGTNVTSAAPGSAQGLHLVVSDIEAARQDLVDRGVEVSGVYHCADGYACRFPGNDPPVPGPHPDRGTYGSFVSFSDPDGNGWVLQEVTVRFPGRVDGDTTFASSAELAQAIERAATAHGRHEARTGGADADWPAWYAEHIVREQSGEQLPT
jgi:catechol 2,3-dioxygenase-like lactoylglutathione lyase family enzyme